MAGLRTYIISLAVLVLFSFFILSFSIDFISQKNPNSEIFTDYKLNNSRNLLNNSISDFSSVSTDISNQLSSGNPTAVEYLFLIFQGAFYIPKALIGFGISSLSAISTTLFSSFGNSSLGIIITLVIGVIMSALLISIVLLIVKAIRSGESER